MAICWKSRERALSIPMLLLAFAGCTAFEPASAVEPEHDEETLARTEFTDRIENFFEYDPLHAGKPSAFLIHLTDLDDGAPVAQARVELSVRDAGSGREIASTTAQVGRVTGIYVAEVAVPSPGTYDIEFRVRNDVLDETMTVRGFDVEEVQ